MTLFGLLVLLLAPHRDLAQVVVTGAPYSCEVWLLRDIPRSDGVSSPYSALISVEYRDSAGRVRIEKPVEGMPGIRSAVVWDLPSGYYYTFDYVRHVAVRAPAQLRGSYTAREIYLARKQAPDSPGIQRQWLGTRMVNGIETEGVRFLGERERAEAAAWPYVITNRREAWVAPDLVVRMLETHVDSSTGKSITVERKRLVRGEPDAALFRVPAGFTVEDAGKAR